MRKNMHIKYQNSSRITEIHFLCGIQSLRINFPTQGKVYMQKVYKKIPFEI